jgi:hypothetical protein
MNTRKIIPSKGISLVLSRDDFGDWAMICPGCGATVQWVNNSWWSGHRTNQDHITACDSLYNMDSVEVPPTTDEQEVLLRTLEALNGA